MNDIRYVYVVLSRSPTILSRIISGLKGDSYTHAALALDKNLSYMFSFGRRWAGNPFVGCFKRESIGEGLYKKLAALPGAIIEISVSPKQYDTVCGLIKSFLSDSYMYGYNYFGLAGNLVGVAYGDSKRFFCSEFVYHVLNESGICDLDLPRGMVRPQTLLSLKGRVIFEGDLKKYGAPSNVVADIQHIFWIPNAIIADTKSMVDISVSNRRSEQWTPFYKQEGLPKRMAR